MTKRNRLCPFSQLPSLVCAADPSGCPPTLLQSCCWEQLSRASCAPESSPNAHPTTPLPLLAVAARAPTRAQLEAAVCAQGSARPVLTPPGAARSQTPRPPGSRTPRPRTCPSPRARGHRCPRPTEITQSASRVVRNGWKQPGKNCLS